MKFYDCRLRYGTIIADGPFTRCETMDDLVTALYRAGVSGGIVYNYMADGLIKKQTRRLNARPFFYGHEVKRFWKVM